MDQSREPVLDQESHWLALCPQLPYLTAGCKDTSRWVGGFWKLSGVYYRQEVLFLETLACTEAVSYLSEGNIVAPSMEDALSLHMARLGPFPCSEGWPSKPTSSCVLALEGFPSPVLS